MRQLRLIRGARKNMRPIQFDKLKRVLCLGAHSDDIEIGCGGTILKLTEEHPGLELMWVVFSAEGARNAEARDSARAFLKKAGRSHVLVKDFRGSFFPAGDRNFTNIGNDYRTIGAFNGLVDVHHDKTVRVNKRSHFEGNTDIDGLDGRVTAKSAAAVIAAAWIGAGFTNE